MCSERMFSYPRHLCSGPVGMAAAAAIASAKKRKRPHQFETNPSIRKRQQTRLLRKLRVGLVASVNLDKIKSLCLPIRMETDVINDCCLSFSKLLMNSQYALGCRPLSW